MNAAARISLPDPSHGLQTPLVRCLHERRSRRAFEEGEMTLEEISGLCFAMQGTTHPRGFRTAPSAGALYPLEIRLTAGEESETGPGVFQYRPGDHALERVDETDRRAALADAALQQNWIARAQCIVCIGAVFSRITNKYGERGVGYTHQEAGCAAQNLALAAVSLGLGTTLVGAFREDLVQEALLAPKEEIPLILAPVGRLGTEAG